MNSAPRMLIQDTCNPKECPIYKKLKLKNVEDCPNFVKSEYNESGQSCWVKDCAPKRLILMEQENANSINGLRKSVSELTIQIKGLSEVFMAIMNQAKQKLSEKI